MKLKQLRKQYTKLTQEEFAKQIGINYETYRSYELNKRKPPIELLIQLADFYNVTLDYIFDRKVEGIITADEHDFLNLYRQLSDMDKEIAKGFIKGQLSKDNKNIKIG